MAFTLLNGKTNKATSALPKKTSSFTLLKNQGTPLPNTGQIVNKTLSPFLGGGTYQMKIGDPNYNAKLARSNYGGLPTKSGSERADIVPVSLSGVNSDPKNIAYEKFLPEVATKQAKGETLPVIKTATDKYLIEKLLPDYNSGKISLREAQVKAVSYLRNEQDGFNKEIEKQNLGGVFGSFADDFVNTANKIGNFLGKKVGDIAMKVVKKNEPVKGNSMTFKVGEGLTGVDKENAEAVVNNNILKAQEEQSKLPIQTKIKDVIVDQAQKGMPSYKKGIAKQNEPIIAENKKAIEANQEYEKTLTNEQLFLKNDPPTIRKAKVASEVLGREIKPENLLIEEKKFKPEEKLLVNSTMEVNVREDIAKVVTAPIRFTIGDIARDYAMTEDELKGSNEKFIPSKDWEKLVYGEEPVQAISKSDGIYGLIGRNVGIRATIATMIALDLGIPGPKTLLKKMIEEKIAKEGLERVAKMGADEYIKLFDTAIKDEIKLGKITEQQVFTAITKAQKSMKSLKEGKSMSTLDDILPTNKIDDVIPENKVVNNIDEIKKADKINKELINNNEWFRGSNNVYKKGGDQFYSNDKEIAMEFGKKPRKMNVVDMPKNPLVVYGKEEIMEDIGYNEAKWGSPMAKMKGIPENERFDYLAKKYAQNKGYDSIIYEDGTLGARELHLFVDKTAEKSSKVGKEIVNNQPFTNLPKRDTVEMKKLAKKAYKLTQKNDGVTISLKGDIPTTGYVYAPKKTTEKIIKAEKFSIGDIESYINDHYDKLLEDGNHFGNWKDGDNFVMDVSKVETDLAKASKGAKIADQDGIFNLDNFETINRSDYEKFIDNAEVANTRFARKAIDEGGTSKGLSSKSKGTVGAKGNENKLILPKKTRTVYKPIEKPVDLRKRITIDKLTSKPAKITQRLSDDAIAKGIIDEFGDLPSIDTRTFKGEAKKIGKIIDEGNQDDLVKIALGDEGLAELHDISPASAFVAVKNQAKKDSNIDLLRELATNEKSVANQSKIWGQNIKMLDEGNSDDAFRSIKKVVDNRKTNITTKSAKVEKTVRTKVAKIIEEAKPNKYDWSNLIKEITCKV